VKSEAQLIEVFSSIQGEGLLVGCRQIFVRMALCNLACGYCDTPYAPQPDCRIEDAPASGIFRNVHNPVALETLYNILHTWNHLLPGLHHSISLTGGEPLVRRIYWPNGSLSCAGSFPSTWKPTAPCRQH
jgi:organic radical activating enzyme